MEEIDFKEFFRYLKKFIPAFIIAAVIAVVGVMIYDLKIKAPIYQAQTKIVIAKSSNQDNASATLNDVNASQKLTSTYSEIAKSELVLEQVIDNLDLSMTASELNKNLKISPVEDTSIVSVTVKDLDAEKSALIANEIAKVFADEVTRIYKTDNVSQLSEAVVPASPANNTLTRDLLVAVLISIVLVGGFAFLKFYFDDSVKHSDDTEKIFGLPITASIAKIDTKDTGFKNVEEKVKSGKNKNSRHNRNIETSSELLVDKMPKSIVSENIKGLRTNLQFASIDKNIKTILITSANASEGKSLVAANLAISFAQADKKVLLVDCDLRKGRVHRLFNITNIVGLSNLLTDDLKHFAKYINTTRIKNLSVMTCGTYPPNPSELLGSKKNKKLINLLRNNYDVIILDGAPVGGLSDSVILSSFVDKTLIVVRDGATSKNDLTEAKDSLEKVGANVAGIVFNAVKHNKSKHNNYYYYSSQED